MPKSSRDFLTDEQVEIEIERLRNSPSVKLARQEINIRYRRRQIMYALRHQEKRGKQLEAMGVTPENMEAILFGNSDDLEEGVFE